MSETEQQPLKNLEQKLENFLNCLLEKAENDSEFAYQLEQALSSKSSLEPTKSRIRKRLNKKVFNAITFLHQNGEDLMREELNNMTDNELKKILQELGARKTKDLKTLERQKVIDEIIAKANCDLNQGSAFL